MRQKMVVLMFLVGFAAPLEAWAQPVEPDEARAAEALRAAQKLFDEGSEAYSSKEFGRAAALWQKAYQIRPEAVFLYNAARATQNEKNYEQALGLSQRAAEATEYPLTPELAARNERLQEELRGQIAEQAAQRRAAEESEEESGEAPAAAPPEQPVAAPRPEEEAEVGLAAPGIIGATAVGVGVTGMIVAAAVYGPRALEARDRAEAAPTFDEYRDHLDDQQRARSAGQVFFYVGAGLAAAGAAALVWDWVGSSEDAPVAVSVGAGLPWAALRVDF